MEKSASSRVITLSLFASIIFTALEFYYALSYRSFAILIDATFDIVTTCFMGLSLLYVRKFGRKEQHRLVKVRYVLLIIFLVTTLAFNIAIIFLRKVDGASENTFIGELILFVFSLLTYCLIRILIRNKAHDETIKVELLNWKSNIVGTLALFIIFLVSKLCSSFIPDSFTIYIDNIVGLILTIYLIYEPIKTLISSK